MRSAAVSGLGLLLVPMLAPAPATAAVLHVRGTSHLETRAVKAAGSHGGIELRGVLLDDMAQPIVNAVLNVDRPDRAPPLDPAQTRPCAAHSGFVTAIEMGTASVRTDTAGSFCLFVSGWAGTPAIIPLRVTYAGSHDFDGTAARVGVDATKRSLVLRFSPPPRQLSLDQVSHSIRVQTSVDPPYAARELPARVQVDLVMRTDGPDGKSREQTLSTAELNAGESARLEFNRTSLGAPGLMELIARSTMHPLLSSGAASTQVRTIAKVWLRLADNPSSHSFGEPVQLRVAAESGGGTVDSGAVEVMVDGVTATTAPVVNGIARPKLTLNHRGGGLVPVSLRYLPASPSWLSGNTLRLTLSLVPPSPWRKTPWIVAAGLITLWLGRGWWLLPLTWRQKRQPRRAKRVTGQPGLEIVERTASPSGGWSGLVVDAHDGTPLSNVTVRVRRPSFEASATPSAVTTTDAAGRFTLHTVGRASGEGALIDISGPSHARLTRSLPPPGVLRVALVARRRALLDQLVAWARHRGQPWWSHYETTPAQIAGRARARGLIPAALWAEAIQEAAFGPDPPDETQEVELAELSQGMPPQNPVKIRRESQSRAKQR